MDILENDNVIDQLSKIKSIPCLSKSEIIGLNCSTRFCTDKIILKLH